MTHLYQSISLLLAVFICFCQNGLSIKESENIYTGIETTNEVLSNSQNMYQFKDLKGSYIKANKSKMSTILEPGRKHIGRLREESRKHYEILNVLWRKTKIFLDFDTTTMHKKTPSLNDRCFTIKPKSLNQEFNPYKIHNSLFTPSYIEFYYLDNMDNRIKHKDTSSFKSNKEITDSKREKNIQSKYLDTSKPSILRRPIFTFHINNRNIKDEGNFYLDLDKHIKNLRNPQSNNNNETYQRVLMNKSEISNKRVARNDNNESKWLSLYFNDPLNTFSKPILSKSEIPSKSTTIYDRIKFFEIYDNNTLATTSNYHHNEKISSGQLEYFEHRIPTKTRKDYSTQRYLRKTYNNTFKQNVNKKRDIINNANENYNARSLEIKRINKLDHSVISNKGIHMIWSKYPYSSVYIYEPLSIYCDAAAINSYWLITAGSCLSRNHKDNLVKERSAYIAYCGDRWWEPESIAYVRRSLVHPLYNHRNKTRRHQYNIGAVQVITSMINSCTGWAPVSVVSHKFKINQKGFPATAIGWGLDRYNTRESFFDLPKRPLVAYEGVIFPKSCSSGININHTQYEKELNLRNVYCLSLPYKGEKKDITHGSLLLIQGKLMAVALQGKARANESFAQYTGIWRLVPWIHNLTRNSF